VNQHPHWYHGNGKTTNVGLSLEFLKNRLFQFLKKFRIKTNHWFHFLLKISESKAPLVLIVSKTEKNQ